MVIDEAWGFDHQDGWFRVPLPYPADAEGDYGDILRDAGFSYLEELGGWCAGFTVRVWEKESPFGSPCPQRWVFSVGNASHFYEVVVDGLPSYLAFYERMVRLCKTVSTLDRHEECHDRKSRRL